MTMPYTFKPEEKHAKAYSMLPISSKDSKILCRAIRKKKLSTASRLLSDLDSRKRDLEGKYYSNAVYEIKKLLQSCEKNADALGLEKNRLFVYASSCVAGNMRRGRRRSDFGHRLKMTNVEIMLVEKGKEAGAKPAKAKPERKSENKPETKQ
jgi:ribosomal protein L22